MTHILGDYIGFDESKLIEFKEFILKIDPISFTQIDDIKEMIINGKVIENFNDIIINNLNHYFKFYLPKYISAFGNLKTNTEAGNIYIGVNDFGEITGIPFIGEFDTEIIDGIKDVIKIFLDTANIDTIFDKIQFEVIKVSYNANMLNDPIEAIIKDHNDKYRYAKDTYIDYIRLHREWLSKIDHFTIKLSTYLTEPSYRHEVAEYIRSKTDHKEYLKIAEQLDSPHQFELLTGIEVSEQKNDKLNVYHWVTNFKDEYIDNIKLQRPIRMGNIQINRDEVYEHQFQYLTNLRKRFIDNNNMNYYIIKISIPTNSSELIGFTNIGSNKVIYKIRHVIDGIPCCI
jgi:hypothetical protein